MSLYDDVVACQCQLPCLIELYPKYFPNNEGRYFVEVGAFDGYHWSNTYPLVNLGWAGLFFEPMAEFAQMCRDRYAGNPLIQVEQCAIADQCGTTKLFPGGSMTTIAEHLIPVWNQVEWIRQQGMSVDKYVMCDMHTLECMLERHHVPTEFDLLSIDAEGVDDRVLMGLNLKHYRPRMIIVELDTGSVEPVIVAKVNWIKSHLIDAGYNLIHTDLINSIFVRGDVI